MQATKAQQFWQSHVDGWRASGVTQKQYSKRHGLNALTLAHWSYALKRKLASKSGQALVPVRLVGAMPVETCVQVQRDGWRISVPVGTDARWLAALMREMATC